MSTIYAVSSGQPPAAIAVVRISGTGAMDAARSLAGKLPQPRRAAVRTLTDPASGVMLDRALVLIFPGPLTATGEDLCELHLHGGRAVVAAVLSALASLPGLRPALPGEFTRRALASGRIDLSEAEGLGDLLMAETEAQRRAAMAAAEGGVSRAVGGWSAQLIGLSAIVESMLDFSDEDDVGLVEIGAIKRDIAILGDDIGRVLSAPPVERLRDGLLVVLAGPPNSGKSTLLNALAGRDAAIVSAIAGTTRDRIEAPIVRAGIAYRLTDTAGLAEATDDPIERIGIDRSRQAMKDADIILWLGDMEPADARAIWLWPRADVRDSCDDPRRLPISVPSGSGLDRLWEEMAGRAALMLPREDQLALNERQRLLCAQCLRALDDIQQTDDLLIVAEQLRQARMVLDRITGATDVEAMLDALFGKFCIGK